MRHCGSDICGYVASLSRERARLFGHYSRDYRLYRWSREWRLASEHLVCHRSQRVDVAPGRDRAFAHCLLGPHVARSPERQASLSDPRTTSLGHRYCDSEISDDRTAIVQQNVLGLDVPMDDIVPA